MSPNIITIDNPIIGALPFTWRQALTQGTTGVIAAPSQSQTDNIIQLANDLIAIIKCIDSCTISSWLRTPIHNTQVGGSPHSAHLLGAAVDLVPIHNTVADCKALIKNMPNRVLHFEINTTNWLHLDFAHDHDFIA